MTLLAAEGERAMRYLVTGATGFLGGAVTRQLVAAGHQVAAVVRDPQQASALAALGVTLSQGDVTDKESMRAPMRGVDGVFHIAGWYKIGVKDTSPGEKVNVLGTRNVLELMRELAIPKGVYTSTLAINSDTHGKEVDERYHYIGPHISEYDRTKWVAHYDVAEPMIAAGVPLVIVMPGVIYGPGDTSSMHTTLTRYLRRKLPVVPGGAAYSWGYIDDIAHGHILAMEQGRVGEKYIIAGPSHTLVEALTIAQRYTGIPVPPQAPPGLVRALAATMGVVGRVVPLPDEYSAEYLRVAAGVTYIGKADRARAEWGYAPRPLEEGLPETLRNEMRELGMPTPD